MSDLDARVSRLESDARRWRRHAVAWRATTLGLLGVVAGAALIGQDDARERFGVVQTERLEVVDRDGNLVGAFTADDRGGRFDLWTRDAQNIVRFSGNADGGDLNLWNHDGQSVFAMWATPDGAETGLWSAGGARQVTNKSDAHGGVIAAHAPSVDGGDAPMVATLHADERGGGVTLANRAGTTVHAHGVDRDGHAHSTWHGSDGHRALSVRVDDGGVLGVHDAAGDEGVRLTADTTGGGVQLFDADDQVAVSAGATADHAGFVDLHAGGARQVALSAQPARGGRIDLAAPDGRTMVRTEAIAGTGGALVLNTPTEKRGIALAARPDGGLFNLFSRYGVAVLVGGQTPDGLGGALTVQNGRGLTAVRVAADAAERGEIRLSNEDGEKTRTIKPLP